LSAERPPSVLPQIIARECIDLSPWVTLETISVGSSPTVEVFHAFRQADYVRVFTMSRRGDFLLVRQYRPVIERWTLEFPGGLRDPGESPEVTAARELREETGFEVSEVIPLMECAADVGRLCNKFFGFFALADQVADPEPGISTVIVTGEELKAHAVNGGIAVPGDLGLLYLAAMHPKVRELCRRSGHPVVPWLGDPSPVGARS
jgi:8-oxo-dGTP pyrophosphatase MutT (NUDIX family)